MPPDYLTNEESLDLFSSKFEGCVLPKEEFTHAAHVAICCIYLYGDSPEEALAKLRLAIPRFNESIGGKNTDTAGFHETLTVFWVRLLAEFYISRAWDSRLEFVRTGVETYGTKQDLYKSHYSFDVVASTEARRAWIAPDRRVPPNN